MKSNKLYGSGGLLGNKECTLDEICKVVITDKPPLWASAVVEDLTDEIIRQNTIIEEFKVIEDEFKELAENLIPLIECSTPDNVNYSEAEQVIIALDLYHRIQKFFKQINSTEG